MTRLLIVMLLPCLWALAPIAASAAELLMFTLPGCAACEQFERDVGHIYPLTDEGKRAPIRRLPLDEGAPAGITLLTPLRGAPTFVLVDGRHEVGRIHGYSNDELFWMRMVALMGELPPSPEAAPAAPR